MAHDIFWLLVFVLISIASPFLVQQHYETAHGDWTALIGESARGPAVPMWMMMSLTILMGALGLAGAASCTVLLVRRARGEREGPSSEA